MAESTSFQLEHFHFGHLAIDAQRISATAGIVARTPRITPEQATEAVQLGRLRPPLPADTNPAMPGALGLFRGGSRTTEYFFVKAQVNTRGLPQVQYILVPLTALRQLGGNVLSLQPLATAEMPSFARLHVDLPPFVLRDPAPPTPDQQIDALQNLLLYCQDAFPTVQGILAGIVQGWPVAITSSPPVLHQRLQFLQGLLCLLPTPARTGITFATHVTDFEQVQAQVKFTSRRAIPAQHVVYDWASGQLLTPVPDDTYSHYILAQLRLDPSLVIEETERLARTAVWRAMHRENLGQALEWVSRRAALDQTVRRGQPADRQMVAAVLREDPTLPDDMRQVYVRHLLAFALALNEPDSADVVPAQCAINADVTASVVTQLRTAIQNGQSWTVFCLLERWIVRVHEGTLVDWSTLLYAAVRAHLRELIHDRQFDRIIEILAYLQTAPPALRVRDMLPEILRITAEPARAHPSLARSVFLLAVESAHIGDLHQLLTDAAFVAQLPQPMQVAAAFLQPDPRPGPPAQVLDSGARVFGDGKRMPVLARLVELAIVLRRPELIDVAALQALLVMLQSPRSEEFYTLVHHVVDDLSQPDLLMALPDPGPRLLIQLLLHTQEFAQAVAMLEYYQTALFGPERMADFQRLVSEVFRLVDLPDDQLDQALAALEGSQIRPAPRALIYTSTLINRTWQVNAAHAARKLTSMVFGDESLIGTVGPDNVLRLLEYHARERNALDAMRVATAFVDHMMHVGTEGAVWILRMWPLLTWDADMTATATELLRRFIRGVPLRQAPSLITYLGQELGPQVREALEAAYLLRLAIGEHDLAQFAEDLHITSELFADVVVLFHSPRERPTITRLRRDLDTMTGGLNEIDRQQIADELLQIPQIISDLVNKPLRGNRRTSDAQSCIEGRCVPQTGVELLYFIGGHFAGHQSRSLDLHRAELPHIFGTRSAAMFLREITAAARLLRGLQAAAAQLVTREFGPGALKAELASLWDALSLYNQRRLQEPLARDCQQLAGLLTDMLQGGAERVLGDSGLARQLEDGRRQPQSALETLRWVHGYFARKHNRA